MTAVRSVLVALLLMALAPAAALAAPPPNDARAAATAIAALPSTQSGTTAEATTEPAEPRSPCFCNAGSVWYRYVAATDGRLILTLTAAGDLDATLDAYLQQRSQLTREDSDVTDAKGEASVSVRVRAGQAYLVRVAQRVGSVAGHLQARLRRRRAGGEPAGPAARAPRSVATRSTACSSPPTPSPTGCGPARRTASTSSASTCPASTRTASRPAARPWTSTRPVRATSPTTRCAAWTAAPTSSSRRGAGRAGAIRCACWRPRSPAGPSASTCRSPPPTPATPRPGWR